MATNNFLPFCPTDTGNNLLTQVQYAGAADRTNGVQPGIASSKLNNKSVRQANVLASQIAQFVCNKTGSDMLDDGDLTVLLATLTAAFAPTTQEYDITNLTIASAVATSALTISIKTKAGTNPSATDPITVGMRSATLTSGLYLTRTLTAALSLVISSGSTLGQVSGQPSNIYVYLIDNAGTLELAASHTLYPEDALVTTVAEGGGGAADSVNAIYSTTLRSNVAIRYIGYILNTQATAGTWASAGTQIQLQPVETYKAPTVQTFTSGSGTYITPAGVKYIRVRMVGGGGGGSGSGTSGSGSGGTGGNTTFGTTLLSAIGGVGGPAPASAGGSGGSASLGSGPIGIALTGGQGSSGGYASVGAFNLGGTGGNTAFGGAGGSNLNSGGTTAAGNTGAGGGGGGCSATAACLGGNGGGAGGFVDALIFGATLAASFSYGIGAAGTAGSAGASGFTGGGGSTGYLVIEEYYF